MEINILVQVVHLLERHVVIRANVWKIWLPVLSMGYLVLSSYCQL